MTDPENDIHESTSTAERACGFGKYFGVCASFHHSKACLCPGCALRPTHGIVMYCAKGPCETYGSYETHSESGVIGSIALGREDEDNAECLCENCAVHKQFAMEGGGFCRTKKPSDEGSASL